MLTLTGGIAVFAGPASAILLIPRIQDWPSGGSEFHSQSSSQELWPNILSFDPHGQEGFCALPNATYFAGYPSGGSWALRDWMQGHIYSIIESSSTSAAETTFNCRVLNLFRGSRGIVPDIVMTGNGRDRAVRLHTTLFISQQQSHKIRLLETGATLSITYLIPLRKLQLVNTNIGRH